MKLNRKLALSLMIVAGSIHTGWAWAAAPQAVEYIKFSENANGEGKTCTIDIKTGVTNMADTDCDNDEVSYFQLNNVPSAVKIQFNSEQDCAVDDWYFDMKTIVHPTTTIWLSIPDLKNKPNDEIIVKGLRMIKNYYSHGNIEGKLSCVNIVRSELP